jgi:DNA-binding NarL/FixJ family response regulator
MLIEDHPLFRTGILTLLQGHQDFEVCGEFSNPAEAMRGLRDLGPDIVIMDISLPGIDGIELTKRMVAERPKTDILIFSMHAENTYALRALRAGAKGYLEKSEPPGTLLLALRQICRGEIYLSEPLCKSLPFKLVDSVETSIESVLRQLSERELEVFQWIGKGAGNQKIAETLGLGVKTVETHRAHIKKKIGVQSAVDLLRFAQDWHNSQG